MTSTLKKDLVIIGAGPGGYVAAIRAAQLGKKVTLIDKEEVGGLCLHHGCIPSKIIIYASHAFHDLHEYDKFGVTVSDCSFDNTKLQSYRKQVIEKLTNGVKFLLKSYNIEVIYGIASFLSSNSLKVSTKESELTLEFNKAVIATGTKAIELPNLQFSDRIISSRESLELEKLPEGFIVVGGGYIGLEIGEAFAKLGSKVTIVEILDIIMSLMDEDVVAVLQKRLEQLGITVLVKSKISATKIEDSKIVAYVDCPDGQKNISADYIMVSVGFKPFTAELDLKNTSVELDGKGHIKVNQTFQSTDKNIFAIGDIIGPPYLAHKASAQGRIVADAIVGKKINSYTYIPSVVFSDPEIAWVGLTEKEAIEKNISYEVKKFPFTAVSKAVIDAETIGFVKILYDPKTEKIIGIVIIGRDAGNLIGEATIAMELGATLKDLTVTVHPHPTLTESLVEAAEYALGTPIHIFDRKLFSKQ